MQKSYGQDDSECHVGEFVEEEFEEGSADLCDREDYPVGKVANVVLFVSALQGQERKVGRDQIAHDAGQQRMRV